MRGELTVMNKTAWMSYTDGNSTAEVDMTMLQSKKIFIDGNIVDPDRVASGKSCLYKRGPAKGLPHFEIEIVVPQLRKIISAFPIYYNFPRYCKKNCYVSISLVIGQSVYNGKLSVPPTRLPDLYSNKRLQKMVRTLDISYPKR